MWPCPGARFSGITANFDGRGNYHLGLREHLVFPEMSAGALENIFGLEVSVITNAGKDEVARELLKELGFLLRSNFTRSS